jgi:ATP-binding cassette, subfamily B, bacterial PglK
LLINIKSLFRFQKKINFFLNNSEKKRFNLLIVFQLLIMLLEMIGIGLIFPILKIITDNTFLADNYYFTQIQTSFNLERDIIAYILLLILIVFIFFKNLIIIIFIYLKARVVFDVFCSIRSKLFKNYLNQDYSFYIKKNPSNLIKHVHVESTTFMRVFDGLISTYSEIFLMTGTIIIFFVISFKITFFLILFFLLFVILFLRFFKNKLKKLGAQRENLDSEFLNALQNGIFSFRETFFYNCKSFFINKFNFVNLKLKYNLMITSVIGQSLRVVLEQFAIVLVGIVIIIFIVFNADISNYIPFFGVAFYSFFKILPSFNKLLINMQLFLTSQKPIDIILHEYSSIENSNNIQEEKHQPEDHFEFKDSIKIENLSYQNDENLKILNNINLIIKKNEKIGIVGKTGSGKSSLLYILMGLVNFNLKGTISIDGINLNNKREQWFNKIGYVSQDNLLLDYNLLENITYESDYSKIDKSIYNKVITEANLEEFIEDYKLRKNLKLGNKGIMVSGGEGQRISLARALYKNSEILFLDEFTSSLDSKTEKKIIENLSKINKTMIIVSHRLSSLTICDKIYEINEGNLKQVK